MAQNFLSLCYFACLQTWEMSIMEMIEIKCISFQPLNRNISKKPWIILTLSEKYWCQSWKHLWPVFNRPSTLLLCYLQLIQKWQNFRNSAHSSTWKRWEWGIFCLYRRSERFRDKVEQLFIDRLSQCHSAINQESFVISA